MRGVQVTFGDEYERFVELCQECVELARELFQNMQRRVVEDRMHRVEPEPIDVEIAQPIQGIVADEAPYLIAASPVVVDGLAPGRAVTLGEVGCVLSQVVPRRAKVVVDDVEDQRQAAGVTSVDESPES